MKTLVYVMLAAALGACATPRTNAPIARDTLVYSHEVARAQQEQLLLNIVRLRYNDAVSFVEIERMTTEDNRSVGLGIATALGLDDGPFNEVLGGDAAVGKSETPTAIYNVLRGGAYAQQLLQPVAPESIFLLSQSGWSVERLMLCCVARIGDLDNARAAAGPTPERLPDNSAFREFARLMRELQLSGDLLVQVFDDKEGAPPRVIVTWHTGSREGDALAAMFKSHSVAGLFGVEEDLYSAELATRSEKKGDAPLRGRSLLGILAALSHAVEVPPEHANLVVQTQGGEPGASAACEPAAPWGDVIGNYFAVDWSRERPEAASVAVPYRGVWFYVDDSCRNAKSTLDLIGHLYALQAGLSQEGARDTLLLIGG
ncbi:MAG: hypothetical protein RLO80_08100 [Hyphomonas sp.]